MIIAAFVSHAQVDIQYELQKLEGFARRNVSQLWEAAMKVFINWKQEACQEADWSMKKWICLLLSWWDGGNPPRKAP